MDSKGLSVQAILGQVKKRQRLVMMFLVGILLVVIALPTAPRDSSGGPPGSASGLDSVSFDEEYERYEEYLEAKVAKVLSHVYGVGRVEVMITLKSDGQKLIEKDQRSDSQMTAETDSNGGSRTIQDQSTDKTSVYHHQSDGSQYPFVNKRLRPEIEGVLVVGCGVVWANDYLPVQAGLSDFVMGCFFYLRLHRVIF